MLTDEMRYKLMRALEANPEISQRVLAKDLGVSLGRINYCLQALIEKGWVKVGKFRNNRNKSAYAYLLTPHGVKQKAALTMQFLSLKLREFEVLRSQIRDMKRDAKDQLARLSQER